MKTYKEDTSIQARKKEIEGKLAKLRPAMTAEGLAGVLINKPSHFAWISAGADNIVGLVIVHFIERPTKRFQ